MRDDALAFELLLRQFLGELRAGPRDYATVIEAWRTHCPRLAVWEEALDRNLIRLKPGSSGMRDMQVVLAPAGAALLGTS